MTFEAVVCPEVSTTQTALFSPKDPCHAAQWQQSPMIHPKNSISTKRALPYAKAAPQSAQRVYVLAYNVPKGAL